MEKDYVRSIRFAMESTAPGLSSNGGKANGNRTGDQDSNHVGQKLRKRRLLPYKRQEGRGCESCGP